jgi:hypothetical protein
MASMTTHRRFSRHATESGPRTFPWPLLLIASPAAVAVWSGWVALGGMCGFGVVNLLPGIGHGFSVNTAITLPVGVEAYGAYALGAWLIPGAPERARAFAQRSAIGSLALGMCGQVVYHLLAAAHSTRAPWPVVVAVACMPVATLGFGAALTHLLRGGEDAAGMPAADAAADAGEAAPEMPAEAAVMMPADMPPAGVPASPQEMPALSAAELDSAASGKPPAPRSKPPVKSLDAERGRAEYRKSVRQGQPLSQRALGDKFGKSRQWGADRIREVEEGPALTAQAVGDGR